MSKEVVGGLSPSGAAARPEGQVEDEPPGDKRQGEEVVEQVADNLRGVKKREREKENCTVSVSRTPSPSHPSFMAYRELLDEVH